MVQEVKSDQFLKKLVQKSPKSENCENCETDAIYFDKTFEMISEKPTTKNVTFKRGNDNK